MRCACEQAQLWNHDRGAPLRVSVNVSSRQFGQHNLVRMVRAHCTNRAASAVPELELTESGILVDERAAVPAIRELHDLGVRLSVDDFGTGYSSLSRLRDLLSRSTGRCAANARTARRSWWRRS